MGASKINKKTLRMLAMDFNLDGETLYKKSSDRTLLRCLDDIEAKSEEDQSKWAPNNEGPYVLKKTFSRGALFAIWNGWRRSS
ncbi:hypothetical protein Peur_031425 [Populus x canadensis]